MTHTYVILDNTCENQEDIVHETNRCVWGGSIQAHLGHIGLNLSQGKASFGFWKDLLRYFDSQITEEGPNHFDASVGAGYLCVSATGAAYQPPGFHRKRTGLNHLAFRVSSAALVNQFVGEFLEPRAIEPLYGGPKVYPDYGAGYYAVYFEDPDRIKLEVVYEPVAV